MADEKIVTNIVATSDFSGLIADVQRTTAALSKLQQELNLSNKTLAAQAGQIQKAFGETLRSTGQFTTHFVTVGSEVDKFGKNLDAGKLKLRDYFQTWQNHTKTSGGLVRDLAKQQVALQNAIVQPLGKSADGLMKFNVHVANGLDVAKNKTALARKELQIYNKVIQDGGVQLINWGKNTQWAGRQLTVGLTVPLAAFGAAAAKAFKEADQELVRLTKVYGGLAATSSTELAKVRRDVSATAKELASAYGASYKETIGLAADIAATGKQGNELLDSTREATRLSILGEVDRQEAMKATLAIQTAFKQNTGELTESINFLNAVENQTSTSLADLVEAIPKAGPVVKALGGDVQDLALYLTAMREGGINASEGANALKSALASIINPTKVAKEQFMGFGIDLEGIVSKNAGNLTQTILQIQAALETLDPLQKSQAIEQLFGKFQFARMNALFENLGKQGSQTLQVLDLMKASSQDLASVAGRELGQITESASGQYKRAIESLKADLAGIGEQFLKVGTFFIKVIDGVLKFVNSMPDPIKNLLGLLGGFTALAGPLIMLTGVFANFIGYVVKGIGHLRSLGKGGEGFKLLTPEILAAEQAGSLIEKTFYSDAKAAQILEAALSSLSAEYTVLAQKASAGSISAQPMISTLQGNVVVEGSSRVADPSSPYIGKPYSRQMLHQNPVAGMTTQEKAAQTIFGVTPGPAPVNQRIGKNPQIYMTGDMERIKGLTEISGVSTGIIAEEAAKWHSMTGALAMQSEAEIKMLKKEVAATGAITTELSTSYQALLPRMTEITTGAAEEAKLIVAQLNASKITVDQARAQVIQLNARVEAMMAETTAQIAQGQGRIANVTTVPLTGQPVVNPVTGKSNMKEMFHKSKTSALVDKIARNLGVRTSGGGYSIETTKPRRLNSGGYVYTMNDGNIVPGPNVNADVVPAMLTPGEFVVNAKSTKANLPLLQAINGAGSGGNRLNDGSANPLQGLQRGHISNDLSAFMLYMDTDTNQRVVRGRRYQGRDGITGYEIAQSLATLKKRTGMHPASLLNNLVGRMGGDTRYVEKMYHDIIADLAAPGNRDRVFGGLSGESFEDFTEKHLAVLKNSKLPNGSTVYDELKRVRTERVSGRSRNLTFDGSRVSKTNTLTDASGRPIARSLLGTSSGLRGNVIRDLLNFSLGPNANKPGASVESHGRRSAFLGMPLQRTKTGWAKYGFAPDAIKEAMNTRMRFSPKMYKRNQGGVIGYNDGGLVSRYKGALSSIRGTGSIRQGGGQVNPNSGMASSMAGMAMMMGGSQMPGMAGQAMTFGGMAMQMAPMLQMMGPMVKGMGSFAGILSKVKIIGTATFTALRIGMAALLGPVGLASMAIGGVVALFLKLKKDATEAGEVNRATFGLTKTGLEEVGIKYKTVSERIKEVNEQLELNRARVTASYEAYTKSGVSGLDLTLKQLKEGVSNAKKEDKESVGLFDKADPKKVNQLAASMKAQYVALGMSVQEATNQIYILIKASNKSSQALGAISSDSFKQIADRASAATYSVQMLGKILSTKGLFNAEEFSRGLDNMLNSLDAYKTSLMETTKTQTGVSEAEALKETMNEIKKVGGDRAKLDAKTLDLLKQQDMRLGFILGKAETLASVFAKYQLLLSGMGEELDIAALTPDKAIKALEGYTATGTAAGIVLSKTALGKAEKSANEAASKAKDLLTKSEKSDSSYIDAAIKNKQKLITKLEEERSLRLKILDLQERSQSFETSIKQAQIKYQEALAAGDMAQAAQEQLNIQQLSGDRQRDLARQAINDKADKERKKLEAEIERLQAQKDAKAKALSDAQANYAAKEGQAAAKSQFLSDVKKSIGGFGGDTKNDVSQFKALLIGKSQEGNRSLVNDLFAKFNIKDTENYEGLLKAMKAETNKELENKQYNKFDSAVKVFDEAVNKFSKDQPTEINAADYLGKKNVGGGGIGPLANLPSGKNRPLTDSKGQLTGEGIDLVIRDYKLKKGDKFVFNGQTYVVKTEKGVAGGHAVKIKMAQGGVIRGPGTGTSDSIPATVGYAGGGMPIQVSNGEYIVKAAAVKQYGVGFLDALNAQRFAGGGMPNPRYNIPSSSVSVANKPFNSYASGGLVNNYGGLTINAAPGMDERMLAKYVISEIERSTSKSFSEKGSPGARLI